MTLLQPLCLPGKRLPQQSWARLLPVMTSMPPQPQRQLPQRHPRWGIVFEQPSASQESLMLSAAAMMFALWSGTYIHRPTCKSAAPLPHTPYAGDHLYREGWRF